MRRRRFSHLIASGLAALQSRELLGALGLDHESFSFLYSKLARMVKTGRFEPLKRRPGWAADCKLSPQLVDWENLLENPEIRFLTENQLSCYIDPKPGISRINYFPLRRPTVVQGKLDYAVVAKDNQFNGAGAVICFRNATSTDVKLREAAFRWWPHKVERVWANADVEVREELTVTGNLAAVRLQQIRGPAMKVEINGAFPSGSFLTARIGDQLILEFDSGISVAPFSSAGTDWRALSNGYQTTASLHQPLTILLAVGYRDNDVIKGLNLYKNEPATIFADAWKIWDFHFTSLVPRLESSDTNLIRLYYYLFYIVRSSLFDIPWEPYVHAYTCPWKTGAIWQWSWNTPMNAITERWLNGPSLAKEGIRLIAANCGALNLGTYLHPIQKDHKCWDIFNWYSEVDQAQKILERKDYDFLFTMPYTVPNSFIGIWETYLLTGDRDFLRENVPLMQRYEETARRRAKSGSLITPFQMMVDEFDYSLRWKPVQKIFTKGGLQRGFDVPVEMVDFNAYLVELRAILARAYRELGEPERARSMELLAEQSAEEINQRLWNEELKFYCDVRHDNRASTRVRAVSGFTPLYACIVSSERKAWLLRALDDPEGFAAPYPIPSVELRHPDLDPNLPTYGGDSLITSGVWMIVNALARNGETARAARYLHKGIEMATKNGVSSAYSYNPIDATPNQEKHTLATQSAILNDLICRYIVGFTPRADSLLEFNPIALDESLGYLEFGPFRYKQMYDIVVHWKEKEYIVSVNGSALHFSKPMHFVAGVEANGKLSLKTEAK